MKQEYLHFCRILKDGEQPLFLDTLIFSRHPFAPLLLRMYLQADSKLDLLCKLSVLSCPRPSMEGAVKSRAMCSLFGSLNLKKCWRHIVGAPLGTWGSCCSTSPFASYVGFAPQVHGRVLRVPLGAVTGVIFSSCITKSCFPDGLSSPVLLIFG